MPAKFRGTENPPGFYIDHIAKYTINAESSLCAAGMALTLN